MSESQKEARTKWVAALRSGKFQQGGGYLATRSHGEVTGPLGYCCLGVACQVYLDEGNPIDVYDDGEDLTFNGERYVTPKAVMEWLGLTNETGEWNDDDWAASLAGLNDSGASFEEIAKVIEAEPEGLFA